jgi:FAD/FMN-containing dehydrogenase
MTQVVSDFGALRAAMSGPVIGPADAEYDDARRVWNGDIDRRPAVIARCLDVTDVSAALRFAAAEGLEVSVRGGAHNTAGGCTGDGVLMIDLSGMRQVSVDPLTRRAQVAGGALLADLDAATQQHALATPAGLISHTGVGGLTLGGGMGWLTRKHGLSIDNLISAEVVTADGEVCRAAADDHPDLFWAIRGGGGNFGVVTRFEFALHPVGPMVEFGMFFFGLNQGADVLRLARDLMADLPPELNLVIGSLNAPPAPFVPPEHQLQPGWALLLTGFGGEEEHTRAAESIRHAVKPQWELVTPMPYVALQQLVDEGSTAWGVHCYEKGAYVSTFTDEVIDVLTQHVTRKTSPMSLTMIYQLDGAYSAAGEDDTAFGGGRSPRLNVFILGVTAVHETLAAERDWVRSFYDALEPHALGTGQYINGMSEQDDARMRETYGQAKYDRLARIKAAYDPDNVFRHGLSITPATA